MFDRLVLSNRRYCYQAVVSFSLGAILIAGVLSCATGSVREDGPPWQTSDQTLVWPLPPEEPRIEYLGSIRAENYFSRGGAFKKLLSLVFGPEVSQPMIRPVAVAKSGDGKLIVADPGVPTVHFFDLRERKHWQLRHKEQALLKSPIGLAVDAANTLYVADSVQRQVFVFDSKGKFVGELGKDELTRPTGVALSADGERLYVVDTLANQIVVFDRQGRVLDRFGKRGVRSGQFNFPTYISVAPDGTLAVSDSLNFRVQRFASDGTAIQTVGSVGDAAGNLTRPKGVAVDDHGRVYVVDAAFENVQIFNQAGQLLLAFGSGGTEAGEFYLPSGITLDSDNTIWIADSFNQRIQVFRVMKENP